MPTLVEIGPVVAGRAAELAVLEGLLDDLSAGRGRALVVRGEAGIGKTTLLDMLAGWCCDLVTVLRARGVQTEAELAFSGLSDLLAPVVGGLGVLPEPQAAALAAALALGPPQLGDRLAVSVATHGLLRAAGRGRPLLVVVDDVQWLDGPSRECVLYAARRAGGPVAFALAIRDQDGHGHGELDGLPQLRLGRLEHEDVLEVLANTAPDLAAPVAQAVAEAGDGNPLALVELPAMLSPEQRRGVALLEVPLTPGGRLRAVFGRRVAALDERARRALLVAAAYQGADLRTVAVACDGAGASVALLAQAEMHGLVRIHDARVVFAHPLIRGAVYQAATADERRAAHCALAGVLRGEARAWHLAAAAIGPDERVAAELERSAGGAAERRGFASASAGLERAAWLSPDAEAFARRMLAAGRTARAAGMPDRALALLAEAAGATADAQVRAQASHLRGKTLLLRGADQDAARLLEAEADRVTAQDPPQAALMLADAAAASTASCQYQHALELAERAVQLLDDRAGPAVRATVLAIWGWTLACRGHGRRASGPLAEAQRLTGALDPLSPAVPSLAYGVNPHLPTGRYEHAHDASVAICQRLRRAGATGMLPMHLRIVAETAWHLGDWEAAAATASEEIQIVEDAGYHALRAHALVLRARLAAAAGREHDSRRDLSEAKAAGVYGKVMDAHAGEGFLELGLERVDPAIAALETVERFAGEGGLGWPTLIPWAPDLVDAYVRAGRAADARRVLTTLTRQADRMGFAHDRALAARCRGMLTDDFDAAFAAALALDEERPVPFERARTLLAYGRRLHRVRRRAEARNRLREALVGFERLGAEAWAAQARDELRAAGARRRAQAHATTLTAQEQRVAAAVARGLSNREVATEMFLAPKTVEFHLGQVYRKLGIGSRTKLVAALAQASGAKIEN